MNNEMKEGMEMMLEHMRADYCGWSRSGMRDISEEIVNILKSKRDEIVFRMKLTSKEEFDILDKRVRRLEKKIDDIKKKRS